MFSICFVKTGRAFLPELYAYEKYLKDKGVQVFIADNDLAASRLEVDAYFRFGGVLYKNIKKSIPEIHEYNSCSTGAFPKLKNFIKSFISVKPVARVFLNKSVEDNFYFKDNIHTLYRDMGVDQSFYNVRHLHSEKIYDIAYVGSISERNGLIDEILKLANIGFRIVLAGSLNELDQKRIGSFNHINYLGRVANSDVFKILAQSKFGLNFCPIQYPYYFQTSTKMLEYLAAGIPVISNNYYWIDSHSANNNYPVVDLAKIKNVEYLDDVYVNLVQKYSDLRVALTWEEILDQSDFFRFILQSLDKK
jgi:glycosyltransferase involved in cell wall biosynthesis